VLRQTYRAREKLFVDYAGQTVPILDLPTGEVRDAVLFVAVLGASNYTYAELQWAPDLPPWIGGHTRAVEFFGGAPALIVPDNLKAGVTSVSWYEPELNPTYAEWAAHYGTAILPARPRHPRDRAKAEVGVQIAERWLLAVLRHETVTSLAAGNAALRPLLERLNGRPFKKRFGSRRSLFEALDRPALRPLPLTPYEFAHWKLAKVSIDYHVAAAGDYYSVPYQLIGERLDLRLSAHTLEAALRSAAFSGSALSGVAGSSPARPTTSCRQRGAIPAYARRTSPGEIADGSCQWKRGVFGQGQGGPGGQHGPGLRHLLHPRRQVGRLPDGGVVHMQFAADGAETTTSPELRPTRMCTGVPAARWISSA
jgi:transposase